MIELPKRKYENHYVLGHNSKGVGNPFRGKKHTEESKRKQIATRILNNPKKEIDIIPKLCVCGCGQEVNIGRQYISGHNSKGMHYSEETKKKKSKAMMGHSVSEETRSKQSLAKKGKFLSKEHKEKITESLKGNKRNWKGGITPVYTKIRNSDEYKEWRSQIFVRDNYTCHKCRTKGSKLNAHHIINLSNIIDDENKLWNTDNGLTFCKKCHNRFHSIFGIKNNTPQQLFKFMYLIQ